MINPTVPWTRAGLVERQKTENMADDMGHILGYLETVDPSLRMRTPYIDTGYLAFYHRAHFPIQLVEGLTLNDLLFSWYTAVSKHFCRPGM